MLLVVLSEPDPDGQMLDCRCSPELQLPRQPWHLRATPPPAFLSWFCTSWPPSKAVKAPIL